MQDRYEWLNVMLIALIAVETPYFLWMSSWLALQFLVAAYNFLLH